MSDETEEPSRLTDPWVGPALSELYGDDHGPTRPPSWGELMELLDECWPAEFFPTLEDDPTRDAGARIVSLLRWVDMLQAQPPTWRMATALGRPMEDEDTTQFLDRMYELAHRVPIRYTNPDSSEFGAKAAIHRFIARSRIKR